jgi:hypothetical protein
LAISPNDLEAPRRRSRSDANALTLLIGVQAETRIHDAYVTLRSRK